MKKVFVIIVLCIFLLTGFNVSAHAEIKIDIKNKVICLDRYEKENIEYELQEDSNSEITYKSSNTSVAQVDDTGLVTGKNCGTAIITFYANGAKTSSYVRVYVFDGYDENEENQTLKGIYITVDGIKVGSSFEIMEKSSVVFGIREYPEHSDKSVKWISTDTRIATVDQRGKVTARNMGECTIYATSTTKKSISDTVKIKVTKYTRYPDSIQIAPPKDSVFKTGSIIRFAASISPADTTERDVCWEVNGGASINQKGVLTIQDSGEITVKAYSANRKVYGEYKFYAEYGKNHFNLIGEEYNVAANKALIITFDSDVDWLSACKNIFVSSDETGNGEICPMSIDISGNIVTLTPSQIWKPKQVYVFVKEWVSDLNGNKLGKNIKYKLNFREG